MLHCHCNYDGVDHRANHCNGIPVYLATRDGRRYALCPDCILPSDSNRTTLCVVCGIESTREPWEPCETCAKPVIGRTLPAVGPSAWQSSAYGDARSPVDSAYLTHHLGAISQLAQTVRSSIALACDVNQPPDWRVDFETAAYANTRALATLACRLENR